MESETHNSPYRIGLVGLGNIGVGVARLLLEQNQRIAAAVGRPVELVAICDKDLERPRNITLPEGILTDDLSRIADDPSIPLVVELAGGVDFPRKLVLSMLEKGKDIVTANKALIANCGPEIFAAARKFGRTIAFEAAVCGGIPILGPIATTLRANRFQSITAIVNGTSNFILTQMEEKGTDYENAVREAQRLGYAEADPTLDVDGSDAAQKLAILVQLGYGLNLDWKTIPRQGIEEVSSVDILSAKELGYKIRLLAVASLSETDSLEVHVSPTLVEENSSLAQVRDAFNAVQIQGDAVGPVFFRGYGAGEMPTASSVLGDVIDTILGRTAITFRSLNCWSQDAGQSKNVTLKTAETFHGKSYLRFLVEDRPRVLQEISGILGEANISIASLIQHEARPGEGQTEKDCVVSLIITTHEADEGALLNALDHIAKLQCCREKPVRMRMV